jgi:hypothetical protein
MEMSEREENDRDARRDEDAFPDPPEPVTHWHSVVLAGSFDLDTSNGELLINGEPFPYYLSDKPVRSESVAPGIHVVWLPLLVQGSVAIHDGATFLTVRPEDSSHD